MALERLITKKDGIPAGLESHYVERDGAFHLDVNGEADSDFRKNNIALMQQLRENAKRFEGIDPDQVRALMAEKAKLEEASALKAGEFQKVLESRVQPLKAELDKKAAELERYQTKLSVIQIDRAVEAEAIKRGLRPSALRDITARAKNTFRLVDGVPQAVESDGATIRMAKDGVTPLSIAEWIEAQVSEAPHLFEPNAGGGAAGNITGGGAGAGRVPGKNPFKREAGSWNLTEQMRLKKTDPGMAARLEAAA
jgi:hypothetical protein